MTEDMSTRPRPRLRAARLTLGRWCALQAVRRTAVWLLSRPERAPRALLQRHYYVTFYLILVTLLRLF